MRIRYNKSTVNEWRGKHSDADADEEYRELKKHGRLEKDGCVYSHLAKLDGETLAICERANDMDYIVEVKREK